MSAINALIKDSKKAAIAVPNRKPDAPSASAPSSNKPSDNQCQGSKLFNRSKIITTP
jgi:hypothetical protein